MIVRSYQRVGDEQTESVYVNVDDTGRVRMTADNLHHILIHLGYTEITKEAARG